MSAPINGASSDFDSARRPLDVQRDRVNEMQVVAETGQRERVDASAAANIKDA